MLGNLNADGRSRFWQHVRGLRPWSEHPIFREDGVSFEKLLGITIHGDGAVFKRDDEVFVWSMSSIFAFEGVIQDVLLVKIPLCIIPERYMVSKSALWSTFNTSFCFVVQAQRKLLLTNSSKPMRFRVGRPCIGERFRQQ